MAQENVARRLVAILAADVVGYSRLMGEDEEATLKTLRAYREVINGLVGEHDGRVFAGAGDSVMAEFPSRSGGALCRAHPAFAEHGGGTDGNRRLVGKRQLGRLGGKYGPRGRL